MWGCYFLLRTYGHPGLLMYLEFSIVFALALLFGLLSGYDTLRCGSTATIAAIIWLIVNSILALVWMDGYGLFFLPYLYSGFAIFFALPTAMGMLLAIGVQITRKP